ncbi:Hypothetical protein FKW44_022372 [Caligus rogercresseyi]|uniref:Uncharacterized protein n=1 Tax=Caligus rogercresseyi TaxID=217165 RepID=A0A7T8GT52_CALRO|nr:Hypothetical protein FKW44_022372 [Caligus rogercresseyi]
MVSAAPELPTVAVPFTFNEAGREDWDLYQAEVEAIRNICINLNGDKIEQKRIIILSDSMSEINSLEIKQVTS